MKLSISRVAFILVSAAIAACTTLPPASMPVPKDQARGPGVLGFVGSRSEAASLAVATFKALGLPVDTVDAEAGFVGASSGLSTRGLGERVGIYFRESGDGSMRMWVVALRKSKTNPKPPDYQEPVRAELEKQIASFRNSTSQAAGAAAREAAGGQKPESADAQGPANGDFVGEFTGACFLAGPNGEVLTTHRAVAGAVALRVHLADGRTLPARVQRVAPALDLALLTVAVPTPVFLSPPTRPALEKGARVFSVVPSSAWPQPGRQSADTDEGAVSRTGSPSGEHGRFETTIAADPTRYGTPVINTHAEVIGVIVPAPASVRVLQARGELSPNRSWAVNLGYARSMLPAVPASPASDIDDALGRAQAALCRIEAQFR